MVAPATSAAERRLAPEDITVPHPWKAIVDPNTAYIYYWNTATNETTYNRPGYPPGAPQQYVENGSTLNGHANGSADAMYQSQHQSQPQVAASSVTYNKRPAEENNGHDMYKRPRTGARCSSYEADDYRRQHEITVLGEDVPLPLISFDSASLPSEIMRELRGAGFTAPTPIQAQSWPIAMLGRDIVAIAKTGSGKTLGYLLPSFLHLQVRRNNSRHGPTVLVLAPTRELATQIHDEATKFGRCLRLTSACVYGGTSKGPQIRDLDRGPDIVIATPGRLNDFLDQRKISLRQVSYLVLDEADRMLDMGFEPQIRKIVTHVPPKRQTLMYTATWPKEVRRIAADLLVSAAQVNIGNTDDLSANKAITQYVEVVPSYEKSRKLEQILRAQEPGSKIIIFCSTKRMCDDLARGLRRDFGAVVIHGDKTQSERDWVLAEFRSGRSPVLVATDVAARGLDIKDIKAVINYDFPTGVEDYVHRIGRTGRAGATGIAHTFLTEQDGKYAKDLIKVLEGANQKVPGELREMAARGGYAKPRGRWDSSSGGGFGRGGRGGGRDGGYGDSFGSRRADNISRFDAGRGGGGVDGWGADNRGWGPPPPAAAAAADSRGAWSSAAENNSNRNNNSSSNWGGPAAAAAAAAAASAVAAAATVESSRNWGDGRSGWDNRCSSSGWGEEAKDRVRSSPAPSASRGRSFDRYSDRKSSRSPHRGGGGGYGDGPAAAGGYW